MKKDLSKLTIFEIRELILQQQVTVLQVVEFFIEKTQQEKKLNAMIEVFDDVIEKAKLLDEKFARGERLGELFGIPVAIKDNILAEGKSMTCASGFMQGFVSPYSATLIKKLEGQDAIIFGRTNMDEFAIGSTSQSSFYSSCKNAFATNLIAGGSSGGSAVAVAAGLVPVAIGTDTGGSVRQPASLNNVVGIKPTYGTVSRFGVVAYAGSLDQAAPITKTIEECELVLKVISGKDKNDATSIDNDFYNKKVEKQKFKIGVIKEVLDILKSQDTFKEFEKTLTALEDEFEITYVSIPSLMKSLHCYYIVTAAEFASSSSRFDGVKYTTRASNVADLNSLITQSRSQGFGEDVKLKILLGNYVLSGERYKKYYEKAKKVQELIKRDVDFALSSCHALMLPTTLFEAFEIGKEFESQRQEYLQDLFTAFVNLSGLPAISVPNAKTVSGLPRGMQFVAKEKDEKTLFEVAKNFQKIVLGEEKHD